MPRHRRMVCVTSIADPDSDAPTSLNFYIPKNSLWSL